jgi:gamma-glutamylcyclotransferase (GGCT)/AIG2-like uncharacterized protein YtfP
MNHHEVFVYGTLKTGFWNNRLMADAILIGQACTADMMLLVDGPFPYMASPSQFVGSHHSTAVVELAGNVYGEVWRVDDATLAQLDRLEGVPHHYTRELIKVAFSPKQQRMVYAYRVAGVTGRFRLSSFIVPDKDARLIWPTAKSRHMA